MSDISGIASASGLTPEESAELRELLRVYDTVNATGGRNDLLEAYYEGDVMAKDIGVDILPEEAKRRVHVDLSSDWARKAVKALANHIRFDGFVFEGRDGMDEGLESALRRSSFESAFSRTRVGTLKKGCAFAVVNSFGNRASVTFHSADNGAALMNRATGEMRCGLVIADEGRPQWSQGRTVVTQVNYHRVGSRVEILRDDHATWHARRVETPPDALMMVPIVYEPTDKKPLGSTRITRDVRAIIDDALSARLAIALSRAFYAIPMRALLGLDATTYKALSEKPQWTAYINPFLMATSAKQGAGSYTNPTLTQLPSNTPEPLVRIIETDAKLFSGATGVPLNSLGIVQDNPSSAEAIVESRRDLVENAQSMIEDQLRPALRRIAMLVMMVESNKASVDDLDDVQRSVMPHFKNPAMPGIASTTDAAMKIASIDPEFAGTDVFFEMVGFDQATISRINSQKRMNQARANVGAATGGQQILVGRTGSPQQPQQQRQQPRQQPEVTDENQPR
jgi:hypothetical protein